MPDNERQVDDRPPVSVPGVSRRRFLEYGGLALLSSTGLGGVLAGCGGGSSGAGASGNVKDFGFVMPTTGDDAAFGKDQVVAGQMGVDAVNSAGGSIPLHANVEDSQADPRIGVQAFQKVASAQHVPVVVSAWSAVINAVAPLADRGKVLLLVEGANDPKIASMGPYVVSPYPLANVDITTMANFLYNDRKKRTAAVIYINNSTGQYSAKQFSKVFEAAGGRMVGTQPHEPGATDYSAQLTKLRAANPDVLHIQSLTTETPLIIKQARQLGIRAQLSSYSSAESQLVLQQAKEAAQGILYTTLVPPYDKPDIKKFKAELTKRLKREPNGFPYCLYLHDMPTILEQCLKRLDKQGKDYTGDNMRNALFAIRNFDTPLSGPTQFLDNGSVIKPVTIKTIKGSSFDVVAQIKPGDRDMPVAQVKAAI